MGAGGYAALAVQESSGEPYRCQQLKKRNIDRAVEKYEANGQGWGSERKLMGLFMSTS